MYTPLRYQVLRRFIFILLVMLFSLLTTVSVSFAAPPAPTGLWAYPSTSSQIYVAWDEVASATNYTLQWRPDGLESWYQIPGYPYTSYQHLDLKCNTKYHYRVAAVSLASGISPWSNSVNATTLACPPGPPTPKNLTATAKSKTQIDLSWQQSVGAASYEIESSDNGINWNQLVILVPSQDSYSHTGLPCDTTRYYRVRAVNINGKSNFSNEASAKTFACGPVKTELLYNGNFEINSDANPQIPDGWKPKGLMLLDKVVNKDYAGGGHVYGERAMLFRTVPLIVNNDRLYQGVDVSKYDFDEGDTLELTAEISRIKGGEEPKMVWVVVAYADGTKTNLKLPAMGGVGVGPVHHSNEFTLEQNDVIAIAVRIGYNQANNGKVVIDNVSLKLVEPAADLAVVPDAPEISQNGIIPLPAAPADLRSN